MPDVVLASASPARLATLRQAGLRPRVLVSGVNETVATSPDPADLAAELAVLKARAVVDRLRSGRDGAGWVVGCDSVLAFDGQILGKPGSAQEAVRRWRSMRGRSGVLHTGHCLVRLDPETQVVRRAATTVHFADVTDREIEAYVATGEPLAVAGAFTVDGLGGAFVRGIEGDHHNVVGISLPVLREMFAELGTAWTDLWPSDPGPSEGTG